MWSMPEKSTLTPLSQKIFAAATYAYYWMRVRDSVASERFPVALDFLQKIENLNKTASAEFYLTRGFVYYATKDDDKAEDDLRRAIELISSRATYSSDDKNYLMTYAVTLYQDILRFSQRHAEAEKLNSLYSYDRINLALVNDRIKRHFPLRERSHQNL